MENQNLVMKLAYKYNTHHDDLCDIVPSLCL